MVRRILAGLAVAGTLMVTACSPSEPVPPGGGGGWANQGDLAVRNVVAVADGQGAATLVGTIVNRGDAPDRLVSITMPGGRARMGMFEIPPNARFQMGLAGPADESAARITLRGDQLKAGRMVSLTFNFRQAGPAELDALVVEPTGQYADVPMPDDPIQPAGERDNTTVPG